MSERISVSVTLSGLSRLYAGDLAGVVETARIADDLGVEQLAVPDHLAIGQRTDRYPYGRYPLPREEPFLEPVTALAAMAATTRRLRLATGVLIAPLRPPLLLAKSLATLDVLSHGRVDLGVGTGWQREEFAGSGVPFAGRAARMDDALRACRALWRDAPASFMSRTVSFEDLWCLPRPVQAGGIPIWLGGALSDGNLARLVEYGSGWMPLGLGRGELAEGVNRLRRALRAAGRDPDSVGVRVALDAVRGAEGRPDVERTLATFGPLAEAGATHASLALARFARSSDEIRPFLEDLARYAT